MGPSGADCVVLCFERLQTIVHSCKLHSSTVSSGTKLVRVCRQIQNGLEELATTCRRNARTQRESERALVPQELWADLALT